MARTTLLCLIVPLLFCVAQPATGERLLPAAPARGLLAAPYLQSITSNTVVVRFVTDASAANEVRYSVDQGYGLVSPAVEAVYDGKYWQTATIGGLDPATTYYYKVFSGGIDLTPWPAITFTTAPTSAADTFTFLVVGDSRPGSASATPSQGALNVAAGLAGEEGVLLLHMGDMVYSGGVGTGADSGWNQYLRAFFALYEQTLGTTAVYPCLGNHELNGGTSGYQSFKDVFVLPESAPAGAEEEYYSFDWGAVHFIALDTNQAYAVGSAQYDWLVADLAATEATWKVAFFHDPAYSSGAHGSTADVQTYLVPLLESYGVDAVFNGHDHDYERTCPILADACTSTAAGGVVYYVSGGGGAPLYTPAGDWFTAFALGTFEFMRVQVEPCRLVLEAIDAHGLIFDTAEIDRCLTPTPSVTPGLPPTRTATPTGTPTMLAIELSMPGTTFGEGDLCYLKLQAENPGSKRNADLYLLLDVLGEYWSYPSWQPLSAGLDHETVTVPQGATVFTLIAEFTMPAVSPLGPLYFYAALFEPGTLSLETLVSNGAAYEFSLGE